LVFLLSLLTRGAWIEIEKGGVGKTTSAGRSSHEERGLKYRQHYKIVRNQLVAPHTRSVD